MKPTYQYKYLHGDLRLLVPAIDQLAREGWRLHTLIKTSSDYCAVLELALDSRGAS